MNNCITRIMQCTVHSVGVYFHPPKCITFVPKRRNESILPTVSYQYTLFDSSRLRHYDHGSLIVKTCVNKRLLFGEKEWSTVRLNHLPLDQLPYALSTELYRLLRGKEFKA